MQTATKSFPERRRNTNQLLILRALALSMVTGAVLAAPAAAFHDGGVGSCAGCHVTHGEVDGQVVFVDGDPLLLAATATDLCLLCHGGQDGVFGMNPLSPPPERGAGNFVFLLEDNLNDAPDGMTNPIAGEAAGHSVVSLDLGVDADSRWAYSPGGDFPVESLGCTSCHDPHGNENFRMLNGTGPVQGGLFSFLYPAPEAEGIDPMDPLTVESLTLHTAYQSGMSAWCGNCHDTYHDHHVGEDPFEHPSDHTLGGRIVSIYNAYDGASNPRSGVRELAYLPAVPFQSADASVTSTAGPTRGGDQVMCLTCHRAHASSAPAAGRWDFNVERLDQDGQVSGSYPIPNPYADAAQGQLCAKCHYGSGGHDGPAIDRD